MALFRRKAARSPDTTNPQFQLPPGVRLYVIGDVHGCTALLKEKFEWIETEEATNPSQLNAVILLGDIVDRGPDSAGTIALALGKSRERRVLLIRGNHEQCLLDFLSDHTTLDFWRRLGGLNTLLSYGLKPSVKPEDEEAQALQAELKLAMGPEQIAFLNQSVHSFAYRGLFFAHAGVRPGIPLDQQKPDDLMWIREDFLAFKGGFGATIVHGHTPVMEPAVLANRINLDTGAYATGRLTCAVFELGDIRLQ